MVPFLAAALLCCVRYLSSKNPKINLELVYFNSQREKLLSLGALIVHLKILSWGHFLQKKIKRPGKFMSRDIFENISFNNISYQEQYLHKNRTFFAFLKINET